VTFFHSLPGVYVIQAVLHSFIALVLIELSFFAWDIRDHLSRFRYRLLPLVLPVFMSPFYQLIFPERGTWHFRLNTALFDSQRWLELKAIGTYPVSLLVLFTLTAVSAVFIVQEILPIFRHRASQKEFLALEEYDEHLDELMREVCAPLGIEPPSLLVIEDTIPILFTQGYKSHTIIISSHLIETLDREELRGALTHEAVHMMRNSSLKTQIIYFLRMVMFYNPVSLVEFRRLVHDDEFICDAVTVSVTKAPAALIGALSGFYYHAGGGSGVLSGMKEQVESHSHNLILDERIKNLREGAYGEARGFGWTQFVLTVSAIMLIGYMVV
jgi:Zn-dependent protease with chaperone function